MSRELPSMRAGAAPIREWELEALSGGGLLPDGSDGNENGTLPGPAVRRRVALRARA